MRICVVGGNAARVVAAFAETIAALQMRHQLPSIMPAETELNL
jgi:hypothetical protein